MPSSKNSPVNNFSSRQFPPERWEEVNCIFCAFKTEASVIWADEVRGHIVRCNSCGLVYRSLRRKEYHQTQHFEEEWTEGIPAYFLEEYRTKNLRRIKNWILKWHPSPGAILDIGSSYGNLLAQFPDTWRRVGIEPSKRACQIAQSRLPEAQIINGTLATASLPEKAFDVITMVDTIYYLPYPLRDLARLPGLLKPEGRFLLEASNFANRGHVYRWLNHPFDDTWMYFYTPASLEKTLNNVGLKVVDRIDLPGHQVGSNRIFSRLITWAEFGILKTMKYISVSKLDLVPHFVLAAQAEAVV